MILCIEPLHNELRYTKISEDLSKLLEKNSIPIISKKRDNEIGSYLMNYRTELLNLLAIKPENISVVCIKAVEPYARVNDNTIKRIMVEGILLEYLYGNDINIFYLKNKTLQKILGAHPKDIVKGRKSKYKSPSLLAFAYRIVSMEG